MSCNLKQAMLIDDGPNSRTNVSLSKLVLPFKGSEYVSGSQTTALCAEVPEGVCELICEEMSLHSCK